MREGENRQSSQGVLLLNSYTQIILVGMLTGPVTILNWWLIKDSTLQISLFAIRMKFLTAKLQV